MSHSLGTNAETLLVLAWAARQPGLRAALVEANTRSHKSELALRSRLTGTLPFVFEEDSVYGPAYHRLFLHRLEQVEWTCASWALRGSSGVFLKESDEADATGENAEASTHTSEETALLWEAITQDERLNARLKRLSRDWGGSVHRGAQFLRLHFAMHMPLLARTAECPFLVQELLAMSMEQICWEELAARLLGVAYIPQPVPDGEDDMDEDRVVRFATMLSVIQAAQMNLGEFAISSELASPVCTLCADLAKRCADTHRELRRLWEENGPVFARKKAG